MCLNFDLPNTSIIYALFVGMAYTLSGTLSLLFSPSGTKALMRQFVADAPKAHESLSTEARRVPVQGTPIPPNQCIHCTFSLWHNLERPIFYEYSRIIGIDSIDKP